MKAMDRRKSKHHANAVATSTRVAGWFREMYQPKAAMASPKKIIRVLNDAKVRFMLMGTHGIGGYRSHARATQDVDILVATRDHAKAVKALQAAFPKLVVRDTPVVTRFLDQGTNESRIDLMKPNQPLFKVAFKHARMVGDSHLIPDLELALVSKFAAMVSHYRAADKKMVDGGDFINMVKQNRSEINNKRLHSLAERVYPGGGDGILEMLETIDEGRTLQL